jgi:hypothetical protein
MSIRRRMPWCSHQDELGPTRAERMAALRWLRNRLELLRSRLHGLPEDIRRLSSEWPWPNSDGGVYVAPTKYPQWNQQGNPYPVNGSYPVEQQAAKLNYFAVAKAWKG